MSLAALDIALRGATVAVLLVLAASLFRDFRNGVGGRLAVAFALGSAAHAATCTIGAASPASIWHAPLIAMSTGNAVVFWLFCRALFDDTFELRPWHGLVWLATAAFSFINCFWLVPAGHARAAIVAINLLALGFIVLAIAQTVASWSADLVEGRRRLRLFIVTAAALYGGMNAVLQVLVSSSGAAETANVVNAAVLAGVVAAIAAAMIRVDGADLFAQASIAAPVAQTLVAPDSSAADQKL